MPIFPEQMEKLDPRNVEDSLKKIENYMRYMCERVELNATHTSKRISNLEKHSK